MSKNPSESMRGHMFAIGKRKILIPTDRPVTDADIVTHNQTIADLRAAAAPYEATSKTVKGIVDMLREDVENGLAERDERTIAREAPLFVATKEKADDSVDSRSTIRTVTRAGGPVGWQAEIASMHADGASDDTIENFLSKYPEENFTTKSIGKLTLTIRGGKNPALVSIASRKDEEGRNVQSEKIELNTTKLIDAFRSAWDIVSPAMAEVRKAKAS
jgi:hypothetical protein